MERELIVSAGKFAEVCGKLGPRQVVHWRYQSPAPLDFNIHFHIGDRVEYPEKRDAQRMLSGTFHPPEEREYCWMWTNNGSTSVRVVLQMRL